MNLIENYILNTVKLTYPNYRPNTDRLRAIAVILVFCLYALNKSMINFFLDVGWEDTYLPMVNADFLMTSKSSFSYKPFGGPCKKKWQKRFSFRR